MRKKDLVNPCNAWLIYKEQPVTQNFITMTPEKKKLTSRDKKCNRMEKTRKCLLLKKEKTRHTGKQGRDKSRNNKK